MKEEKARVTVQRTVVFFLVLSLVFTGFSYAVNQSGTVRSNEKGFLKGGSMYVEYDFGSWLPHDDAWLKAEVYSSDMQISYCQATIEGFTYKSSGRRAIVEVGGVDYFPSGSYSETQNKQGRLYLKVK